MWIVKNPLRATLTLKGLGVSIPSGAEFDLDAVGRDTAEQSPQVIVALEEGYLRNIFKAAREAGVSSAPTAKPQDLTGLMTSAEFEKFKAQFMDELHKQLPQLAKLEKLDQLQTGGVDLKAQFEEFRKSLSSDLKEATDDLRKVARDKILQEKRRIMNDASLSDAEMKARLSFLDEQERELEKNFETIGQKVEKEDGDVMDKADLLSGEI